MGRKHKAKFRSSQKDQASEITEIAPSSRSRDENITASEPARGGWLTTFKASAIIIVTGVLTFFSGLANDFVYDDKLQIVDNIYVHSVANIGRFFKGSTFFLGQGGLAGQYYRPLMTTSYSAIYSIFGSTPMAFHAVQLGLHIFNAIMLFVVFKYFFKPAVSLVLAMLFLIHPINSQAVFYIASLQEPLFFLFGIVALWLLIRFQDKKSSWHLLGAAVCLLMSLLSKETGILFVAIALIYVYIGDKRRLFPWLGWSMLSVLLYLSLKVPAVGLLSAHGRMAPIEDFSLLQRLLNAPAIILAFLGKFLLPFQLAHAYYWAYSSIDFQHVILPLLIDIAAAALAVYFALWLRKRARQREFVLFIFFSSWLLLGLALHSQIIPLDMTLSESWFYFPIVGLLGMIGIWVESVRWRLPAWWSAALVALIIVIFGMRTSVRGLDWRDQMTLASRDIAVSKEDYVSECLMAEVQLSQGKPSEAKLHALRSINIFPSGCGYSDLGNAMFDMHDYEGARQALQTALKYQKVYAYYENAALAYVLDPGSHTVEGIAFAEGALRVYPHDFRLWLYLAQLHSVNGDGAAANAALVQARKYGDVDAALYNSVMSNYNSRK